VLPAHGDHSVPRFSQECRRPTAQVLDADFAKQALALISAENCLVVAPLVEQVALATIRRLDKQIENLRNATSRSSLLRPHQCGTGDSAAMC